MPLDKTSLTVADFMTRAPVLVDEDLPLSDAWDRMFRNDIRHLCVMLDNRVLVGMISQRDLGVAASTKDESLQGLTVKDAMSPKPFSVPVEADLLSVVEQMEERRLGAVVVMEGSKPAGVFTTVDALRAVRSLLKDEMVEPLRPASHVTEAHEREKVTHARSGDKVKGVGPGDGRIAP